MRANGVIMVGILIFAAAASAGAAQRTFVSTEGSDSNACTLAAPCRSFLTALSHTDPEGEIIVLDSGGYGRVTIAQAVTIEAPAGVYAGISVLVGTNGIDVNAPGATVTLRGLSINGQGGDIGVNVSAVGSLRIDRCRISNMNQQGVLVTAGSVAVTRCDITGNGHDGVWANGVVDVLVQDSVLSHNLSGAAFFGGARAIVRDTTLTSNVFFGIFANGGPTATPTTVRADGVNVSHNGSTGLALVGLASAFGSMTITRSTILGNAGNCVYANATSGPVTMTISDTTISAHTTGFPCVAANAVGAKMLVSRTVVVDNAGFGFSNTGAAVFESRGDNTVRNNNGGAAQTIGTITTIGAL